jgi:hypothetical protein
MANSSGPLKLFAELLELDRTSRDRRVSLSLAQKQRRQVIAGDLRVWAVESQRLPGGAEQRAHPRAAVRLRVQLLGGPRPIELSTDSLAVGGLSATISWTPRCGDLVALRLSPPEPEEPIDVMAEVVWYDARRSRAGMRFSDLDEEGRALIEHLVFGELLRGR